MKANHYLDNGRFLLELIEYKKKYTSAIENNQDVPRIPEFIGHAFILLVENFAKKPDYSGYPPQVLESLKSDAILNCLQCVHRFDPDTSKNPFAYFTMVISRCFWRTIAAERKRLYQKYKIMEGSGILDEPGVFDEIDSENQYEIYDNISEFIETYEYHEKKKKDAKKKTLEKFFE